jgi:hypothetical protein
MGARSSAAGVDLHLLSRLVVRRQAVNTRSHGLKQVFPANENVVDEHAGHWGGSRFVTYHVSYYRPMGGHAVFGERVDDRCRHSGEEVLAGLSLGLAQVVLRPSSASVAQIGGSGSAVVFAAPGWIPFFRNSPRAVAMAPATRRRPDASGLAALIGALARQEQR